MWLNVEMWFESLIVDDLNRFSESSTWGKSLSHSFQGNLGSKDARYILICALKVWIALAVALA